MYVKYHIIVNGYWALAVLIIRYNFKTKFYAIKYQPSPLPLP